MCVQKRAVRSSNSAQQTSTAGGQRRRLRAKRRTDDDTSPTVSVSSTRTCMTEVPHHQYITRAMKRYRSDGSIEQQATKRTRKGTVRQ